MQSALNRLIMSAGTSKTRLAEERRSFTHAHEIRPLDRQLQRRVLPDDQRRRPGDRAELDGRFYEVGSSAGRCGNTLDFTFVDRAGGLAVSITVRNTYKHYSARRRQRQLVPLIKAFRESGLTVKLAIERLGVATEPEPESREDVVNRVILDAFRASGLTVGKAVARVDTDES